MRGTPRTACDFVAIDQDDVHWLLETKGQETEKVKHKDHVATLWCENASLLTGKPSRYLKVPKKGFEKLQPESFAEVAVLQISRKGEFP